MEIDFNGQRNKPAVEVLWNTVTPLVLCCAEWPDELNASVMQRNRGESRVITRRSTKKGVKHYLHKHKYLLHSTVH